MYSRTRPSPAAREAESILRGTLARIAKAGRLTMSVERAAQLVHSCAMGVVFALIATPPDERDPRLSEVAREMVVRTITTDAPSTPDGGAAVHAAALAETLRAERPAVLTPAEHALLTEWLTRLADATLD